MSAESTVHVQNRTAFLVEMQEVAKKLKIFLGIGYKGPRFSNFALINDDGIND
jgi:hypothetical protein